MWNVRLVTQIP